MAPAAALSITLLFFLWLVVHIGGNRGVHYFDDLVTALAALGAALACLLAAVRQRGAGRRFWALLASALGAWTLAELTWAVYDLVLHRAVPVPSWADVGYLAAIPLAAAALLSHPGLRLAGRSRVRATVDGLAIGTALLVLSWTFVLGSLWRHTDLTTAGGIVALAYPFGDVLIIFLVILSVRSVRSNGRGPLLWVLAGLFAMAISDSTYAYLVEIGKYSTGNIVDVGWVVAYLAIAVGATCDAGALVAAPSAERSLLSHITPYFPVLLGLSVVTFEVERHDHVDRFMWFAGLILALLAGTRQAIVLVDRRRERFTHPPDPSGAAWAPLEEAASATPHPEPLGRPS